MLLCIGKKGPFFAFCHSHQLCFFAKLNIIWLFRKVPCRIASSLDLIHLTVVADSTVCIDQKQAASLFVFLIGVDIVHTAAFRRNKHRPNLRRLQHLNPVCFTVCIQRIIATVFKNIVSVSAYNLRLANPGVSESMVNRNIA